VKPPYVSIVIVGRNDDYGQDFGTRINTFVRSLDHQVAQHPGVFELLVVEWNPEPNHPGLDALIQPSKNFPVRIITVPREVHAELGASQSFLEFHGKNTGVRRARGEFVLVTNPDVLFTQQLIDSIAAKKLRLDTVYRTDRFDFNGQGIETVAAADLIDFALSRVFVMHGLVDTASVSYAIETPPKSLEKLPKSRVIEPYMHTNACGDFVLASRENFYTIRGFYETTEHRWHVDSISLMRFHHAKIRQHVWLAPLCIFHHDHRRGDPDKDFGSIDWTKLYSMKAPTTWGLAGIDLPEKELS